MHAIADAGLPQAPSYQGAFPILAEAGLIETPLADKLAGWAGFGNEFAHFFLGGGDIRAKTPRWGGGGV